MANTRTFVAIALPQGAITALEALTRELRRTAWGGACRWSAAETMHLTLKFLGDVPDARMDDVFCAVRLAAQGVSPLTFELAGLGCFPHPRRPSVVWVGTREPSGRLAELARDVDEALGRAGWPREVRPYYPHLTIARVRRGAAPGQTAGLAEDLASHSAQPLAMVDVQGITVYGSVLTPSGPVHTRLCECPLGRGA